jgi:succinate-semialdehyde dehydrogenase/glutarate-semialdehyde dehydrogenase
MRSVNPFTEELLQEYPEQTPSEIRATLDAAGRAAEEWARTGMDERAILMHRLAEALRRQRAVLASLMTAEMGKPIAAGEGEIEKCALCCEHFADRAADYLAFESILSDATRSGIRFEPLGAVLAIMPWNFPFWQVFRFAAPALMAGNVGLLKHAPNVTGCALAIEQLFNDAGFPAGAFASLRVELPAIEAIIHDPVVRAVTLTGSEGAGRSVGAIAGAALKKVVLELGGSDPFIVLPDADPVATAQAAAKARCVNSGQSCIAAKRFIVVGDNPGFERAFVEAMQSLKLGDPANRDTDIGPLARLDLLEHLDDQVKRSMASGAKLIAGGQRLKGRGFFYPATILSDVRPGTPAFDEETFGPVAALVRADDINHAIHLANQSRYGLGASIWTRDTSHAERAIVPRLEAGAVFVNGPVKSDPVLPFGGIKSSGHGRELAALGIREFTNAKTVWVADARR